MDHGTLSGIPCFWFVGTLRCEPTGALVDWPPVGSVDIDNKTYKQ